MRKRELTPEEGTQVVQFVEHAVDVAFELGYLQGRREGLEVERTGPSLAGAKQFAPGRRMDQVLAFIKSGPMPDDVESPLPAPKPPVPAGG